MKTPPTFFVNPDLGDWQVISEAFCEDGGNFYDTKASGFDTEEQAQAHADSLNAAERA